MYINMVINRIKLKLIRRSYIGLKPCFFPPSISRAAYKYLKFYPCSVDRFKNL